MKQQTFSDIEYSNRKRKTKRGRPPRDIEVMLRMYLMQNWFNLSDATTLLHSRKVKGRFL